MTTIRSEESVVNQSAPTMLRRGINRKIHHIDGTTESRSITMSLRIKNPIVKLFSRQCNDHHLKRVHQLINQ